MAGIETRSLSSSDANQLNVFQNLVNAWLSRKRGEYRQRDKLHDDRKCDEENAWALLTQFPKERI